MIKNTYPQLLVLIGFIIRIVIIAIVDKREKTKVWIVNLILVSMMIVLLYLGGFFNVLLLYLGR